jgi:hypothetical protein
VVAVIVVIFPQRYKILFIIHPIWKRSTQLGGGLITFLAKIFGSKKYLLYLCGEIYTDRVVKGTRSGSNPDAFTGVGVTVYIPVARPKQPVIVSQAVLL